MDVHPSRELVGSGQRGGRDRKSQAHVRIWSTESLQTLYVFGMGELDTGVLSVAFSQLNGGSYILAVDGGRESILSVWQWQWGHLLGKVAVSNCVDPRNNRPKIALNNKSHKISIYRLCKKDFRALPSTHWMIIC
jgi:hypothetical protein